MANSPDPDQLASSEANWSESTLFAKAGYIQDQQDKGCKVYLMIILEFLLLKSYYCWYSLEVRWLYVFFLWIIPELSSQTPLKQVLCKL